MTRLAVYTIMTDSETSTIVSQGSVGNDPPDTDFDAIVVEGNLDIIHAMIYDVSVTIGCYGAIPTGKPSYSLLLCTEPYQIWLIPDNQQHATDTKAAIINWLSNKRSVQFPPHSSANFLFTLPQKLCGPEFCSMLFDAGIERIYAHGFAYKATPLWGVKLMTRIRQHDPESLISFYMGAVYSPTTLHNELGTEAEYDGEPQIVLAMIDKEDFIEAGFHGRPQHFPVFSTVQAEVNNFSTIPSFGSVSAGKIGKLGGLPMQIESLKAYGTYHHTFKQHMRDFHSFTTTRTVKKRIDKLRSIIDDLETHSNPGLRIECRFILPPNLTDDQPFQLQHVIADLWSSGLETIIELSNVMHYMFLPIDMVCNRMRDVIDYFTSHDVHPSLQCYIKTDSHKLNLCERDFFQIILMFLGLSSTRSSYLFARNYYQHDQGDSPIDYLIIEIIRRQIQRHRNAAYLQFIRDMKDEAITFNLPFMNMQPAVSRALSYIQHPSLARDMTFNPSILFRRYPNHPPLDNGQGYDEFIAHCWEQPFQPRFFAASLIPEHAEDDDVVIDDEQFFEEVEENIPEPIDIMNGDHTRQLLLQWLDIKYSHHTGKYRINRSRGQKAAEDISRMAVILKIEAAIDNPNNNRITPMNWPHELQLLAVCSHVNHVGDTYMAARENFLPIPPTTIINLPNGDMQIQRSGFCNACSQLD